MNTKKKTKKESKIENQIIKEIKSFSIKENEYIFIKSHPEFMPQVIQVINRVFKKEHAERVVIHANDLDFAKVQFKKSLVDISKKKQASKKKLTRVK